MRKLPLTVLAIVSCLALLGAGTPSSASPRSRVQAASVVSETLALDSHESADDGAAGPVSTSDVLESGSDYLITVDGTWSTWEESTWDNPGACGDSEPAPETPSKSVTNGPVSADAEFVFAEPAWGGEDCSAEFPRHFAEPFVMDIGSGFTHQEPIDGVPDDMPPDHQYLYRVTGQGQPASFQLVEDPTSDNYGVLTITVEDEARSGLVSQWKFDEASGTSVVDSITGAGHSNDGSLRGNATRSGDVPPAIGAGSSLLLDGTGDFVQIPDDPSLDFDGSGPLTIALWAKRTGDQAIFNLIAKRSTCSDSSTGINYQLAGSPSELDFNSLGDRVTTDGVSLVKDEWHHVAATFDPAGSLKLYLDGAEVAADTAFTLSSPNSATLLIGDADTCNQAFGGLIDDVRIYGRTLTASEVADLAGFDEPPRCKESGAICGGSGDEDLQGTSADEFIFGGEGNDTIDGGGGNDVIVGGDGKDVITGGPGRDKITGGEGKDRIVGDAARGSSPTAKRDGVAAAQQASAPDQLAGGGGNDSVLGGGGADKVAGGTGEDKILGEAGNDKLKGDSGNDLLKGGGGVNDFNGGPGKDHCVISNKKDETSSCEKKTFNFTFNFFPTKYLRQR